ncbi:retrotransposon protein, putative, LINE subclass [Hordeum vulgare]|nr:retrotransposon protein, putative, LINE subclass [Hordeum vulgare]
METKRRFRFELFRTKLEGFMEVVQDAWTCDLSIVNPFHRLDVLLRNTARAFTSWGQRKVGHIKLQIGVAKLIILRLDCAQDSRLLTPEERWLRVMLKQLVLGLASLERTIAR